MCSGPGRIATACCSRCARRAASGCTPRRTSGGSARCRLISPRAVRGRLAGLAGGWRSGHGPQALLACPPGELHDLALMISASCCTATGDGSAIWERAPRSRSWSGPLTPRVLAWSSWPLPVRRPSSRSARSSPHWPGAPRSPSLSRGSSPAERLARLSPTASGTCSASPSANRIANVSRCVGDGWSFPSSTAVSARVGIVRRASDNHTLRVEDVTEG